MTSRRRLLGGVVCAALLMLALVAYVRAAQGGIAVDYVAFATGGRIAAHAPSDMYNVASQADAQAALLGYRPEGTSFPQLFVNPPFVAEMMRPLAGLPLQTGTDIFCGLALAALFVAMMMLARRGPAVWNQRWLLAIIAAVSTGGAYGVLLGQWSPLLEVVAVAALFCMDRDRSIAAGLVLSLLLVKPQLVWLLVPGLVITARWRLLAGFVAGASALGVLSLAIVGTDGMHAYFRLLASYAGAPIALTGRSVADFVARCLDMPTLVPALSAVTSVVALAGLTLWRRHIVADEIAVSVLLILSLLASGHTNPEDFGVLCIAAAVFAGRAPRETVAVVVAANLGIAAALVWWQLPLDIAALGAALVLLVRATPLRTSGAAATAV